ncbi:ROK family protein [Metabacillus indicus]|uniref:ROK family protein n=1 Tax=Metabacillus indicus TaxID=246786 RepID=UPI003CE6E9C6
MTATLAIDLGGSKIAYGLLKNGSFIEKAEQPFRFFGDEKGLLEAIEIQVEKWRSYGITEIGIGSPGRINDGTIYSAVNLGYDLLPIQKKLEEAVQLPVYTENDATAALLGELVFGSLQGSSNAIFLTIGTGIGGGLVIDGKVYKGAANKAGEFGHYTYMRNGISCSCGKKGCWEMYASSKALIQMAIESASKDGMMAEFTDGAIESLNGKMFFKAVSSGDREAILILEQFTTYLADGIVDLLDILDVETVAVGGGISRTGLIDLVRNKVQSFHPTCNVQPASLGNDAGLYGAAVLSAYLSREAEHD